MDDASHAPVCFDPALAVLPTRVVEVARLFDPLEVPHSDGEAKILIYRRAMMAGARFPPVSVVAWRGRWLIADGHKRFAACRGLGAAEIVVEVWTIRRWVGDQWRQLSRKTRQQARVLLRSPFEVVARRELRRLLVDTAGHWRRIVASIASRGNRGSQ